MEEARKSTRQRPQSRRCARRGGQRDFAHGLKLHICRALVAQNKAPSAHPRCEGGLHQRRSMLPQRNARPEYGDVGE
ncbi:hypothetical protein BV133_1652 [Blastochloris viridis]|uniref:Uncharacterized protein n=1 Tax=Blastochloris viridis TaxID=1079 RepID=A0A182D1E1_BLAVI|nr:hypothetical protein BV133_1652 [Blastochloris viridis]